MSNMSTRRRDKISAHVFVLLFLAMLILPSAASAYVTENVFIVVIDGIRKDEAFADPTHQYIPRIWNDLRPQGTIITEFETRVDTATLPGHFSIASGTWEEVIMDFNSGDGFRPNNPTFFESYRKQFGLPAEETFFVSYADHAENSMNRLVYSLHPLYGATYGASLATAITGYQMSLVYHKMSL